MSVPSEDPMRGAGTTSPRPHREYRWRTEALALVADLNARGLNAVVCGHGAVRAMNPNGAPEPDNPEGQLLAVGLRQEVWCRPYPPEEGALWWFWAWSGETRTSEPELEPLCPLADTRQAAERIAHVLSLREVDGG